MINKSPNIILGNLVENADTRDSLLIPCILKPRSNNPWFRIQICSQWPSFIQYDSSSEASTPRSSPFGRIFLLYLACQLSKVGSRSHGCNGLSFRLKMSKLSSQQSAQCELVSHSTTCPPGYHETNQFLLYPPSRHRSRRPSQRRRERAQPERFISGGLPNSARLHHQHRSLPRLSGFQSIERGDC